MEFEKWLGQFLGEREQGDERTKDDDGPEMKKITFQINITKEYDRKTALEIAEVLKNETVVKLIMKTLCDRMGADIGFTAGIERD